MTVTIHPTARIECDDLQLGDGTVIHAFAELAGRRIVLGRDSVVDQYATIGGGSAEVGELVAGDWCMLGKFSEVNIARPVHIGDEFGLSKAARVFTHGAWLSEWDGFPVSFAPVTIGHRVWLHLDVNVMPGVTIGDNVVVGTGSLVNRDLPSGCFAAGTPAEIVRKDCYPTEPTNRRQILERIVGDLGQVFNGGVTVDRTQFYLDGREIIGPATPSTERMRHQLRRHGIRFPFSIIDGKYARWWDK